MKRSHRLAVLVPAVFVGLSGALAVAVWVCYWLRPDWAAAVTFWPAWLWVAPGAALAAPGFRRRRPRLIAAAGGLWLVFLMLAAEEPRSLARIGRWPSPAWQTARQRGEGLRVISINCAEGDKRAALEAAAYRPDIVLLQETPDEDDVVEVARTLFGDRAGIARGIDTDVIARGEVTPVPLKGLPPYAFKQARVRLESGLTVEVFSVHFLPPALRFDVWTRACWREHAEKRAEHRFQAEELAAEVAALPSTRPVIVGGDFNVPGGDGALRSLRRRLRDAFGPAGKGWGNTVLNDMPVARFDQIWISDHFRAHAVVARRTTYSDHRMVICDLVLRQD